MPEDGRDEKGFFAEGNTIAEKGRLWTEERCLELAHEIIEYISEGLGYDGEPIDYTKNLFLDGFYNKKLIEYNSKEKQKERVKMLKKGIVFPMPINRKQIFKIKKKYEWFAEMFDGAKDIQKMKLANGVANHKLKDSICIFWLKSVHGMREADGTEEKPKGKDLTKADDKLLEEIAGLPDEK